MKKVIFLFCVMIVSNFAYSETTEINIEQRKKDKREAEHVFSGTDYNQIIMNLINSNRKCQLRVWKNNELVEYEAECKKIYSNCLGDTQCILCYILNERHSGLYAKGTLRQLCKEDFEQLDQSLQESCLSHEEQQLFKDIVFGKKSGMIKRNNCTLTIIESDATEELNSLIERLLGV